MTNINDNRDLTPLELHLSTLRAELQQTLQRTQTRRRNMFVGLIVLVLIMACYWTFIYTKLARIDSDYVADLAYGQVQSYVDKTPEILNTQLREHAPDLYNYAQDRVLATPAMGIAYVRDTMLDQTKVILAEAQPQFDKAISDAIAQAKASPNGAFDSNDPAKVDKFIDALAAQIHTDAQKTMDKVYADYDRQAQVLVNHIETLAQGKNLDAASGTPSSDPHQLPGPERKMEDGSSGIDVLQFNRCRLTSPGGQSVGAGVQRRTMIRVSCRPGAKAARPRTHGRTVSKPFLKRVNSPCRKP